MTEKRQIDVVVVQPSESAHAPRKKGKVFWAVLNLAAVLFWSYAIIKIFVFDVDVYLVSFANPELVWVLNYKLLIFLGLILIAMLVTRSFDLGFAVAYIVLYLTKNLGE
jgi:hypothetical protein